MLLEVEDLQVKFRTPDGVVQAVNGVSFQVDAGETLAVVGESGSGKSVSMHALVGLTDGAEVSGRSRFLGVDLLGLRPPELRRTRGAQIGMIFQDPLSSLHPYYRVGWQIAEQVRAHRKVSKAKAQRRAIELLTLVGIPHPDRRADEYPHQYSGGMRQRAMIAMAMSLEPKLLIADEPTTALDVTVQAQVLAVLQRLQAEFGTAIILITHDLGIVAEVAAKVNVMYGGRIVESGTVPDIFGRPQHPYTIGLLGSLPSAGGHRAARLSPIPGQPPSLLGLPPGCSFAPRCSHASDLCRHDQPLLAGARGGLNHRVACWAPEETRTAAITAGVPGLGR